MTVAASSAANPVGPRYDGQSAVELASAAEAALLGIVHLSGAHERPLSTEDVYRTMSGLTRMIGQVPEVVTRLRAVAVHDHETATLAVTSGPFTGDPAAAIGAMADAVDALLGSFGAVRQSMDDAQAALAGIAVVPAPSDA